MKISEIVNRNIVTVPPHETLESTIRKLNEHKIGAVLIMVEGQLAGIFTERDLLKAMPDKFQEKLKMPIEAFMTKKLQTIESNLEILEAEQAMARGKFRHLPVVDSGKLIGIISSKDIFESLLITNQAQRQQLEAIRIIVGTMSHEINNPLAIILGRIESLKQGLKGQSKEQIGMVENNVVRIVNVLRKLSGLEEMVLRAYGSKAMIIDVEQIKAAVEKCVNDPVDPNDIKKAS